MTTREVVDVLAVDLPCVPIPFPGASAPANVTILRRDPETGGLASLVEFPPGWNRAEAGTYDVAEEMLVLDGEIQMSGLECPLGTYLWNAPGTPRYDSRSDLGAHVLAFFAGPAEWRTLTEEQARAAVGPDQRHRILSGGAPGKLRGDANDRESVSLVQEPPDADSVSTGDRDVYGLETGRYVWVPAGGKVGKALPHGTYLVRVTAAS